jgi:D-glycerate 3-kinase
MTLESWILAELSGRVSRAERPFIGLNGPVGAGKTTLARRLQEVCAEAGLRLAVVSIDDAYLPWQERQRAMAGNPFGVSRVPPGSHEPQRLLDSLQQWRAQPAEGPGELVLPRFDKTLRDGDGDRVADWYGEADALLLEGWLVGCRCLDALAWEAGLENGRGLESLSALERQWLPHWNQQLAAYQPLWDQLDLQLVLWPARWELPRRWRLQAEARQRKRGGGWMAPAALNALVRASVCSLPPWLYQQPVVQLADWVRVLDGQRRSLEEGSGAGILQRIEGAGEDQASSPSSSATG